MGRLYRTRAPALRLYARQRPAGEEDLVQDAFVKLAQQSPPPAEVLPWLYRVVRNGASAAGRGEAWFAAADDRVDAPDDPAAKSPDLPAAHKFVARTKEISAEQVETMPAAQVLLRYIIGMYTEQRDTFFRVFYLTPARAIPLIEATNKQLREPPGAEGQVAARLLLPAVSGVVLAQSRVERNLAALRVVEALRSYAAAHDGRLPDKLTDATEVPIPDDPCNGKPFEYTREGDMATVVSRVPGDPIITSGIRYRVTIRKK
ncbi:MAG: hypothetical protein JWO38_1805 [Gemmataceae bacterium]|nr:hypothetical protein [Gemmataceae bacterium]